MVLHDAVALRHVFSSSQLVLAQPTYYSVQEIAAHRGKETTPTGILELGAGGDVLYVDGFGRGGERRCWVMCFGWLDPGMVLNL